MLSVADEVDGRSRSVSEEPHHRRHRGRRPAASFWAEFQGEHGDGKGSQGGHDVGAGGVANAAAILVEGEVSPVVESVLDLPVVSDEAPQLGFLGLGGKKTGDAVGDLFAL